MKTALNLLPLGGNNIPPMSSWKQMNGTHLWDAAFALEHGTEQSRVDHFVTEATHVTQEKTHALNWLETFWVVMFTSMLTVSIIGNLIVIWIIACHRRMRTVTNYFLLNLAIADLFMASFNGAPNFVYMLRNDWIFGKMLCVINNFTAYWTVSSCVFTMTTISVDRWIAIVKPLQPRMTKTMSWLAIIGIWIGSCVLSSPALCFTQLLRDERSPTTSKTHCLIIWPDGLDPTNSKYEFGYNICLLVITYLIPMTAMAICYGSMSWELWFTQVGEITQRQMNSRIAKRKVVRMFIFVVVTFAVCWLPYHGYFIYMHIDKNVVYKNWIQHLYLSFFFLAMSQSAINPVIVISMNSRFRSYIQSLFQLCSPTSWCSDNGPRNPHYVVTTPPLQRRASQSCSHSKSRSGGGPSGELNRNFQHKSFQPNRHNQNGHEMVGIAQVYNNGLNGHHLHRPTSGTRGTYC